MSSENNVVLWSSDSTIPRDVDISNLLAYTNELNEDDLADPT